MLRDARLKFTRELSDTLTVTSVDPDGLRINGELWSKTIALTADEIIGHFAALPLDALTAEHFESILQHAPELVLIGSGKQSAFPPRDLMFWFARQGIGLEVMDTAAAARTFNVLVMEGRRVAAVLYPE